MSPSAKSSGSDRGPGRFTSLDPTVVSRSAAVPDRRAPGGSAPAHPAGGAGQSGPRQAAAEPPAPVLGRASVPPPRPPRIDPTELAIEGADWRPEPQEQPGIAKRGWEMSGIGALIAFICWGIWAASTRGRLTTPLVAFLIVLAVAVVVFVVTRMAGKLILVQRMGRPRRSARGAHALTGLFLAASGVAYLRQTPWVVELYTWLRGLR